MNGKFVLLTALMLAASTTVLTTTAVAHPEYPDCGGDVDLKCASCTGWTRNATTGKMDCTARVDCTIYANEQCLLTRP